MSWTKALLCTLGIVVGLGFPITLYLDRDEASKASACAGIETTVRRLGQEANDSSPIPNAAMMDADERQLAARRLVDGRAEKAEQMLLMIVNAPDCFTPEIVAQAQARLTR